PGRRHGTRALAREAHRTRASRLRGPPLDVRPRRARLALQALHRQRSPHRSVDSCLTAPLTAFSPSPLHARLLGARLLRPRLPPPAGFLFGPMTSSYRATYVFAGTRRIASPITSSARSSSFLKRTHDFPMSSFLPVFAHVDWNHLASAVSPSFPSTQPQ